MFKKSKKKQLTEIKYKTFLLRSGLEVQKEHAVHLAETYANKEDFAKHDEGWYNGECNAYEIIYEKLESIIKG